MKPFLPVVALACGLLLALAGCSNQPLTTLYQLDSGNPPLPQQADGIALLLGPVVLADYLQREVLLQRQNDGQLTVAAGARWAGSLAADSEQLLLRQLAARLDSQRLLLAPAGAAFSPDVQVLLTISRLDAGPQQPAVLEAQWRLLDRAGQLRDSRLVRLEQAHDGLLDSQVQAQSRLLQALAAQLAQAVMQLPPPPPALPAPKPAQPRPPRTAPQIPVVEPPGRGDGVLSF